jgi:hypothetical protein
MDDIYFKVNNNPKFTHILSHHSHLGVCKSGANFVSLVCILIKKHVDLNYVNLARILHALHCYNAVYLFQRKAEEL